MSLPPASLAACLSVRLSRSRHSMVKMPLSVTADGTAWPASNRAMRPQVGRYKLRSNEQHEAESDPATRAG